MVFAHRLRRLALFLAVAPFAVMGVLAPVSAQAAPNKSELRFGGSSPHVSPQADAQATAPASAQEREDIARVERYLNGIKTLKSRFDQTAPDGRHASGTLTLSRPGKMRLVYDPPFKDFVVADGLFIFYWDGEMSQQSSAPLGSSLADFILRDDLKLSGAVTVVSAERYQNRLEVTLAESKDPGKGSMTLVFKDKPLALDSWRVFDATGQVTEVHLIDPKTGIALDPDQFIFRAPSDSSGDGGNFSRR